MAISTCKRHAGCAAMLLRASGIGSHTSKHLLECIKSSQLSKKFDLSQHTRGIIKRRPLCKPRREKWQNGLQTKGPPILADAPAKIARDCASNSSCGQHPKSCHGGGVSGKTSSFRGAAKVTSAWVKPSSTTIPRASSSLCSANSKTSRKGGLLVIALCWASRAKRSH